MSAAEPLLIFRSSCDHCDAGYHLLDVSRDRVVLAPERGPCNPLCLVFWDYRSPLLLGFSDQVSRRSLGASRAVALLHDGDVHLALRNSQDVRV